MGLTLTTLQRVWEAIGATASKSILMKVSCVLDD